MRIYKYLFILISFVCLNKTNIQAQSLYPVKVQPSCAFPSVFLDDYKSPENFRVLVSLTDVNEPQYDVNLKVEFYSADYSFKSINGITVSLVGGDIYTLNQSDLSKLLDVNDLTTVKGSTDAPSKIQEGLYTISFQAYDAINTNIPVSNGRTDFTVANVQMNEGPLLTNPQNQQEFDFQKNTQNIMFAWTPRSIAFSPSRPVKYRLKIVEVFPADRNPYDAVNTNQYLVNNQVFEGIINNAFNFDPSNFTLKDGAVYAWQVQAYEEIITPTGIEESSARFNDNGYSDVFTFSTAEVCEPVFFKEPVIELDPVQNKEVVTLAWEQGLNNQYYEISYKIEGSSAPWAIVQQTETTLQLDETLLEKGAVYEYKVASKCNKWHPAKDGGTFELKEQDCTAPEPILVKTNDAKGIVLEWEAPENAIAYDVVYTNSNTGDAITENVTEPQITLPKINTGSYTVQVNGVCSGNTKAEGKQQELAYNETSVLGDCPLPKPFSVIATRFQSSAEKHMATINWPSLDIHESYDVSYWHKDSLIDGLYQFTNSNPTSNRPKIVDGQLYKTQIVYTCKGGKTVTSPEVGFRITGGESALDLLPGTGDCFPPADLSAEVRSENSARIEWNKISGAEEYEVIFWPEVAEGETENHQEFMTTAGNSNLNKLEPGKTYHYKVRCKCGGKFSIFSEEGTFELTDVPDYSNCDPVEDFVISDQTESSIQLMWPLNALSPPEALTGYRIKYKTSDMMWKDAYTENLASISTLIDEKAVATNDSIEYTMESLEGGTTYQFEISATCGTDDKSEPISVEGTTLTPQEPDCASGGMCDISSTTPISKVEKGDTLGFADSKMVVVDVQSLGDGLYSGTGYTETPMVGFTDVVTMGVKFTNMFVNDKNCVTDGEFDTEVNLNILPPEISSKINAFVDQYEDYSSKVDQMLSDTQGAIQGGQEGLNQGMDYFQGGGSKGMPVTGGLGNAVEVPGSINAGDIVINNGKIEVGGVTIDEGLPALVKDADGKVFSVDEDGKVIEAGQYSEAAAGAADLPADEDIKVTFSENASAQYSYDAFREAYDKSMAMKTHYMYIDGNGIDAKAIIPGAADPVNFTIEGGSVNKLSFVNGDGFEYNFDNNNKKLTLVGGPEKDAQIIYALYEANGEKKRVGALLVSSYAPQTKKVVLVTFNQDTDFSKDKDAIQRNLNKVYHTVGVHYEIEVDNSFRTSETWCLDGSACVFQVEPSAKLSNDYSGVEKDVVDAYIEHAGADALDPDAAYIFLTNVTVFNPNETLAGKMSFGKQFGFLYDVNLKSEAELGNTLAHELGHGNYKLQHVFDDIYLGEEAQGNTDNIMDYAHEDKLNKLQWDIIQEPGVTWGLFEKDKDQELSETDDAVLLSKGLFSNYEGFFMSLSGNPIFLPKGFRITAAIHNGSVVAFEIPDGEGGYEFYSEYWSGGQFVGYRGSGDNYYSSSVQYNGQDINFFTNILEVNDEESDTKTKHPVIAKFYETYINSRGSDYTYSINKTYNEQIVLKQPISAFYTLSSRLKDLSSGRDKLRSNKIDKFIGGVFSDQNPNYYTFNYNSGKYQGFATDTYINFLNGAPAQAPNSSIYIEYDGHRHYDNEPIYIPEAELNKSNSNYVFKVGGNTVPVSTHFSMPNSSEYYDEINRIEQKLNPFTISKIIGAKKYRVEVDDPSEPGVKYTNFIIGADLFITYLGNKEASPSIADKEPLTRINGHYQTSISYGDNLFLKYSTSIPALSAYDTEVLISLENIDGTNKRLITTIGSGIDNSFNTTSAIGNASSTVVEDFILTIVLRKKNGNVVLSTKKIKVSVIPRETIDKLTVTDLIGGSESECKYDKAKNRIAEIGEILYVVVSPECDNDLIIGNLNKKLKLDLKTSRNNLHNVPVNWSYRNSRLDNNTAIFDPVIPIVEENSMSLTYNFTTPLSTASDRLLTNSFTIKSKFFDLKVEPNLISDFIWKDRIPNLPLEVKADIFNTSQKSKILFVYNNKNSVELKDLSFLTAKETKSINVLNSLEKFTPKLKGIKSKMEKIPFANNSNSKLELKLGFWSVKYSNYFQESATDRFYENVDEYDISLADASIKLSNKIDFTDKVVNSNVFTAFVFNSVDIIASALGDQFKPFVGIEVSGTLSTGISYTTSTIDKIGEQGLSSPISTDNTDNFKGSLCLELAVGPAVTFDYVVDPGQTDETSYKFEASGLLKPKACSEIKYDPVKADFDFKLVLKPIVFTSGIKFTVTEKGEKPEIKLNTEYTFEITKTDYTIYP